MNTAEIKNIIATHGLRPNKRLGQNFLVSGDYREKIISAMDISSRDNILEVGPGLGALTERLIEMAGRVTAVEIDAGFSRFLSERFGMRGNFILVHDDFLKHPPAGPFTKIVSNLPYYCSSEMLFAMTAYNTPFAYVMLQKELADRIVALPGDSAYGALSVTLGLYYATEVICRVSRESFYPRPEVMSSFLRLNRRTSLALDGPEREAFHSLVKSAFWGRRKTLLRALADTPHLDLGREVAAAILAEAGVDGGRRGEELDRESFVALARAYMKIVKK